MYRIDYNLPLTRSSTDITEDQIPANVTEVRNAEPQGHEGAIATDYSDVTVRKESFRNETARSFFSNTDSYAENGFYYTGPRDQVRCFYCNVGLKDWQDRDTDPFIQHVIVSRDCQYIEDRFPADLLRDVENSLGPTCPHFRSIEIDTDSFISILYSNEETRRRSLGVWSNYLCSEMVSQVIKHGYYYTGMDDEMRCAYCETRVKITSVLQIDTRNTHKARCPIKCGII